jgi:adenylate cyclase
LTKFKKALDPSPRTYPEGITLLRRSTRGRPALPPNVECSDVENWLIHDAARENEMLYLYEMFIWYIKAAGLPVERATLHMGTLHPGLVGFTWNWNSTDGFCDEVKVAPIAIETEIYRRNPLYRVFEFGETIRRRPQQASVQAEFALLAELASIGIEEYIALPLGSESGYRNAVTLATMHPAGFSDAEIEKLRRLLAIFAIHFDRHIAWRIANNVLAAYLGPLAAAKVLKGSIKRGAGESIHAVIFVSDMRGFTDLSGRLSDSELIALLNAYFEKMAGAVLSNGGEVLKFIGDGLLAVFPIEISDDGPRAAMSALSAARQALGCLEKINKETPLHLAKVQGWRPLRAGIALHEGEVFFGNIGSPERLDFTVIGPAVNEASRVEALNKVLGRNILITERVARYLKCPLDNLGEHALRGVATPMSLYSPTDAA